MFQNQVNKFDSKSTALARLKNRRDELRATGVGTAALSRLIHKMERPLPPKLPTSPPVRWFCTEKDLQGGGYGKIRQPKEDGENKKRKGGRR